MNKPVKVYQLSDFPEFYAGTDLDSCIELHMTLGNDPPDEYDILMAELTENALNELTISDPDTGKIITFAEQLKLMIDSGCKFPCEFASVE